MSTVRAVDHTGRLCYYVASVHGQSQGAGQLTCASRPRNPVANPSPSRHGGPGGRRQTTETLWQAGATAPRDHPTSPEGSCQHGIGASAPCRLSGSAKASASLGAHLRSCHAPTAIGRGRCLLPTMRLGGYATHGQRPHSQGLPAAHTVLDPPGHLAGFGTQKKPFAERPVPPDSGHPLAGCNRRRRNPIGLPTAI